MILLGCLGIGAIAARRPVPLVVPLLLATAFAAARWRGYGGIGAVDALHARWTFEGILGLSALSIGRTLAAGGRLLPSGVWAVAAAVGAEAFGYVHLLPAVAFALYWATDARDRDAGAALAAAGAWSVGRSLLWSVLLPDHTWDGVASEVAVGLALVAAGPRPALLGWLALGLAGAAPYTWVRDLPVGATGWQIAFRCDDDGCNGSPWESWSEAEGHAWIEPRPADTLASAVADGERLVFLHRDPGVRGIRSLGVTEIDRDPSAETVLDLDLPWTLAQVSATCEERTQCTFRGR